MTFNFFNKHDINLSVKYVKIMAQSAQIVWAYRKAYDKKKLNWDTCEKGFKGGATFKDHTFGTLSVHIEVQLPIWM